MSFVQPAVVFLLNLIVHLLVLAFVVVTVIRFYQLVKESDDTEAMLLRTLSIGIGLFSYFAASALGITLPEFLMQSAAGHWFGIAFGAIALPGLAGWFAGSMLEKLLKQEDDRRVYGILLVGTLVLAIFVDVYAAALSRLSLGPNGGILEINRALLPNATFVAGAGLFLISKKPRERRAWLG